MTIEEAKEIFINRGFVNGLFDGDKWRQSVAVISKWLEQITDLKEAYNKGYKDGQEALAVHLELCKEEGSIKEIYIKGDPEKWEEIKKILNRPES